MIELLPLCLVIFYLVPFMVAAGRNHDSLLAILVANVLFGWTVIGWFAVFFWALFSSVDNIRSPRTSFRNGDLGLPEARRVKNPMVVSEMRSGDSG